MEKEVILITGVAGMLGSNFSDWIIENHSEYGVLGLDNLSGGYLENINPKVKFYLRDAGSDLTDIFEENRVKFVYHFAAYAAEGLSPFIRKFNYANNLITTANVVNYCIKYNAKLIFASSMSVYGFGTPPFTETHPLVPIDPYGIAKMASEKDIQCAGAQHGLEWAIIRPHNILGLKQNISDKYRNVVGIWMRQILNDEPLTIYGSGTQTRAFSWIFDYCEPFWKVANENYPSPIFNVGGDQHYTLNEVAEKLISISGKNVEIRHLQPRHEVAHAYCDHFKAKQILGFVDKTPLDEMLKQMWEWAKIQPKREVKEWEEFELDEGIYDFWKK